MRILYIPFLELIKQEFAVKESWSCKKSNHFGCFIFFFITPIHFLDTAKWEIFHFRHHKTVATKMILDKYFKMMKKLSENF